jgi:PKD repeat protein
MKQLVLVLAAVIITLVIFLNNFRNDEWDHFPYPELRFIDEDKTSEGAHLFNELVDNPDSLFKSCIIQVCKTLYLSPSEVPVKKVLIFNLRNTDGVAATGGDSTTIDMFLSTRYIADYFMNHDKDKEQTLSEITGIMIHELTHAYQHSPIDTGGYPNGNEHFSCVEGVADATRLENGYVSISFRRPGGHWNDGYKTTGFFISWLSDLDENFLYKFNQSTLTIKPWTWDKAVNQILGKSVSELWCDYQKSINPNGVVPVANFHSNKVESFSDSRIFFNDQSSGDPFEWNWTFQGGTPSQSPKKNPEVAYKFPGKYNVKLTVKGPFGKDSIIRNDFIIITRNPAGVLFSDFDNEVVAQHDNSPHGEDISKLFDNNSASKYLTFNNKSWVQLKSNTRYHLTKYCLVSANDAPQRDPKSILVKGSNDGINWVIIDKKDSINFRSRGQTMEFPVVHQEAHSYYKFEFSNQSGPILQIADLLLFGDESL